MTPVLMHLVGVPWALVVVGAFGPAYVARAWTRLRAIDANVSRRDVEIGLLDQLPMFRPLALPAIEGLADRLEVHEVAVGETVVAQGDHGDRFFVIQRGTARVVRDGIVLRDMAHGDGFGEIALLRDVPRRASVIATSPLRLRSLSRDASWPPSPATPPAVRPPRPSSPADSTRTAHSDPGATGAPRPPLVHLAAPAPVAQWIERRFPKPCVAGSSPAGGTAKVLVVPYVTASHRRRNGPW